MPASKDTQSGSSAGPPAPQHGAVARRSSPTAQQSAAAQRRQVFGCGRAAQQVVGAAGGRLRQVVGKQRRFRQSHCPTPGVRLRQVVGCGRWSAAAGGREE